MLPFSSISLKNTEIKSNEEFHPSTLLDIGKMGSLRVFLEMSVLDIFPLKKGN
jgi:hypothetical protein